MSLPSATNITTSQPIYTGTPGAGLWLIECQPGAGAGALNTNAATITFTVTVDAQTVTGDDVAYYKKAGVLVANYPIQVLAAAGKEIIISVKSSNGLDIAVTSNTPTAVLQAANAAQIGGIVPTMGASLTFATTVGTSTYAGADTSGTTELLLRVGDTDLADIIEDTENIQSRLPAALVDGRVPSAPPATAGNA